MFFTHRYSSGCRRRWAKQQGAFVKQILTITARIELNPQNPGYDENKDAELQVAAVNYSKSTGDFFDIIEFEQGIVDA